MTAPLILAAIRSPFGRHNGALAAVHPVDLAALVFQGLAARTQLDPSRIGDVLLGTMTQTGEQGSGIARTAALAAGWPEAVPGGTLQRGWSSGLQAILSGAQAIAAGTCDLVVAGGVESMSRVPLGADMGPMSDMYATRFPNQLPFGLAAEAAARRAGIGRVQADAFALQSQQRYQQALERGAYQQQLLPIDTTTLGGDRVVLQQDELPRPDTTAAGLAACKPSFKPDGILHAGNSARLADGAVAILLANPAAVAESDPKPLARIVAQAATGSALTEVTGGAAAAARAALHKAGLQLSHMQAVEVDEVFASQALATATELGLDPAAVNQWGGAIAHGHPAGATGAMLLARTVAILQENGGRYGLCTMASSMGMGLAAIVERL